jgi:hypothetical protein
MKVGRETGSLEGNLDSETRRGGKRISLDVINQKGIAGQVIPAPDVTISLVAPAIDSSEQSSEIQFSSHQKTTD